MTSLLKTSLKIQYLVIFSLMTLITFINSSVEQLFAILGKTLIICVVSYLMTIFMRRYKTKETVSSKGKAVLITGCDSGFGNRLAYKLNQNGFRVYATVLSAANEGSKQLVKSAVFEDKMHVLEMDVTNDENVRSVYKDVSKELESNGDQLWALVNNAGMFAFGHIEWSTLDTYKNVFDVNVFGMVRVTRVFSPLIKASKGRIVNMVSLGGRFTFENGAVYCMSKHTMIAFSDALRREMHKFGIKVSTIEPGLFKTPMTDENYLQNMIKNNWDQTEEFVRKSYGDKYFEAQKETVKNFHKDFKSGANIELVVDDMIDAVQSAEPEIRYRPIEGIQSKIMCLLPVYMPSQWLDQMIYSKNKTKPASNNNI